MPRPSWLQIQEHAPPFGGDAPHRGFELLAAVAPRRVKHVAGQALRVDAHQDVLAVLRCRRTRARCGSADRPGSRTRARGTCPYWVGSFALATRLTSDSFRMRYLIRSAIVIISRPCFFANFVSSGTRAIVPSSFMISQMTPAGYRPAMRARSTAASVCPARTSTPPGLRAQGMHVAGPREVRRPRRRIDGRQHGGRAVVRRDARRRPAHGVDRRAERRLEARRVLAHDQRNLRARRAAPPSSAGRSARGRTAP